MARIQLSLAILLLACLCSLCITCVKADEPPFPEFFDSGVEYDNDSPDDDFDFCESEINTVTCPCVSDKMTKYPIGWKELTDTEQCIVKRRCKNKPQCCIDLCGDESSYYICENENDYREVVGLQV
ncbi:hypothetical protein K457DRAFT_125369 [Linnemannia elongata AG-77]|uniref:WAP domain-containing protein n=1 Tax=Linnemannia elongata AG-77 TaxID=1314771 RepID=A0A197JY03_9FUNG|nr:hypothetical protein K457DRAFT_125369 [Linnemannia elongata AG-77]